MEREEIIKSAARRMKEHLNAKGVKVSHTAMLEAIAKGFGLENWRTLKAVIDAPREQPKVYAEPGTCVTWLVEAIYLDNTQPYGDYFTGRTPLEAAVVAMMDRRSDFSDIGVTTVTSEESQENLYTSWIHELELLDNRVALQKLHELLKSSTKGPTHPMNLAWLEALLALDDDDLEVLTDWEDDFSDGGDGVARAYEQTTETPSAVLLALCDEAEALFGSLAELERNQELAIAVYQLRVTAEMFEQSLNNPERGLELDIATKS